MLTCKEIFVRIDRCVGCHTCELSCLVEHSSSKNLFAALSETIKPRQRLYVEMTGEFKVPVLCRHCEDAPCVSVCPTGAAFRDEQRELVLHEPLKCIGCLLCVQACPFGMMGRRIESRIAVKCDRCPDRDRPVCVESCPTGALLYSEPDRYAKEQRRSVVDSLVSAYLPRED